MKETLQKFLQSYSPSISDENVESFASITKYKKLFDKHVNFFVRSFPELFKRILRKQLKIKH